KGNAEQERAKYEERKNPVGAIERSQVIEKDFEHDDSKQKERLPAQQGRFLLNTQENQSRSVDCPKDGKRKITREISFRTERGFSEVVPEFKRKRDQRKDIDQHRVDAQLHFF